MKITALFLAFYIFLSGLIPRSDLSQLAHIPDLISHYQLHQKEASELGNVFSFWDFLVIHFINPDDHLEDGKEEHHNLPFQSFHHLVIFIFSTFDQLHFNSKVPVANDEKDFQNVFYLSGFLTAVFHPPSYH